MSEEKLVIYTDFEDDERLWEEIDDRSIDHQSRMSSIHLAELAKPKSIVDNTVEKRPTFPTVPEVIVMPPSSLRIIQLAESKTSSHIPDNKEWKPPTGKPQPLSSRMEFLALPKPDLSLQQGLNVQSMHSQKSDPERLEQLAKPKPLHPECLLPRPGGLTVSRAALNATSSTRVAELALPKPDLKIPDRKQFFRFIPKACPCSDRMEILAQPRKDYAKHMRPYPVPRPIPRAALNANASIRIRELAVPKKDLLKGKM